MRTVHAHVQAIAAVCAGEWRQIVSASRTFVFLAGMLFAVAVGTFLIGGLYDSDYASLGLVWLSLPAVAIAFVPALGARAFADDGGNQEIELMLSLPVSDVDLVLGKWLAGAGLLAVALVALAPIAVTVAYLGTPDWGSVISGALGALLMLWTFHAIAIFASALTAQQTTAYVVAVLTATMLTILGWDLAAQLAPLPAEVLDAIRLLSPKYNLDRMASGRVELDAVLSFILEIGLALAGASAALGARRRSGAGAGALTTAKGAAIALAAFAVLAVAARLPPVLDATSERIFTLSEATRQIARAAPDGTEIELYWSESDATVPAHVRDFAHRVRHLLARTARVSNGRIALRTLDPSPDSPAEWTAISSGIRRVPLSSGGSFFLGAVLRNGERRQVMPYLDEAHSSRLEYEVALSLSRMGQARVPKAGLLTALVTPSDLAQPRSRFAFVDALKAAYDLAVVPFFAERLPEGLDVLVVVGNEPLKRSMLYAIDQHVMQGKGLVVLLDPLTRFNASNKVVSVSATRDLNTIADLLAHYGIAFSATVVGDADLAALVSTETNTQLPYPFWLRLTKAQFASTSPIAADLQAVVLVEPGYFTLRAGAAALAATGPHSGGAAPSELAGKSLSEAALAFKADNLPRTLAAAADGPLASPFETGVSASHIAKQERAAVFAVADVDWILDQAATTATEAGERLPSNGNLALFGNIVEAASGDHRLMSIRARTPASRRFTRVEDMLRTNAALYRVEASEAQLRIDKVETAVGEILKATKARSVADLPADIRTKISRLYADIIPDRKRLREIRSAMRADVERLGRGLTLVNLVSGPLLAFALWRLSQHRRRRPLKRPIHS